MRISPIFNTPPFAKLVLSIAAALVCVSANAQTNAPAAPPAITNFTYEVVHTYLHRRDAFTQGLVFLDGKLLESTGRNGFSNLREDELTTGTVLTNIPVPAQYFAEGLALLNGKLYQLTWQSQVGFIYDLKTFKKEGEFHYTGEGWGLTTDGKSLILSDGTSDIRYIDPATFAVERVVHVTKNGDPQANLNELEMVNGQIYANIWQTDFIACIDPATGFITGMIDLSYLLPDADHVRDTDVLNGIAYDPVGNHLYVTGKLWPKLFEIRLKPKPKP